ncbi:hypothetical protein [Halococcus saccharolyticus]|uniref:Uncharacterized protein n=1 Tax=Halococcus saccharolyticus DSM 5350 TaxID=1227455 RepID=M0MGG5_9EURY|nr:hypothetical protein [Halococcus saccharolyticus]EMA44801.1 hypothetical protein C449_09089 [Halococcus saccharolyticus DSM 5350]
MSLAAIVSGSSPSGMSIVSTAGIGIGSLFAAVALVFLLGYLDLYNATKSTDVRHRRTLIATVLPLLVVFLAVVLVQSMRVLAEVQV